MSKTFFVDLTKCTACRGCQVACKQWKKLPAEKTKNVGSHQNPQDLSGNTIRLVRFSEVVENGKLQWLFFPEQCRHCVDAPCADAGYDVPGSVIHDPDTGAVVYTELTKKVKDKEGFRDLCPYDIPRINHETGLVMKCDMCYDRVAAGKKPACVTSCPTGTMNFGEREEMLALAEQTLAKVKKKFPNAELVDKEDVRVVYLVQTAGEKYYEWLMADASPRGPLSRKQFLAKLGRPVKRMTS